MKSLQRWHKILIGIVVTLGILLSVLPIAARYIIADQLVKFGAETAAVEDVDINLFSGRVAITGLNVTFKGKPSLSLGNLSADIAMLGLFQKNILVESVLLQDLSLNVSELGDGQYLVAIPVPPKGEPEAAAGKIEESGATEEDAQPFDWGIGIDHVLLERLDIQADVQQIQSHLVINKLLVNSLYSWIEGNKGVVEFNGNLNGAPLVLGGAVSPFTEDQNYQMDIDIQRLALQPVQPMVKDQLAELQAFLNIKTKVSVSLLAGGGIQLTQKGSLGVEVENLEHELVKLTNTALSWNGETHVTVGVAETPVVPATIASNSVANNTSVNNTAQKEPVTPISVELKGQVLNPFLGLNYKALNWDIAHRGLKVDTTTTLNLGGDDLGVSSSSSLVLDDLTVRDAMAELAVLELLKLAVQDIAVGSLQSIKVGAVNLESLRALNPDAQAPVATLTKLDVTAIQFDNMNQLIIQDVLLEGLQAEVTKDKDGMQIIDGFLARLNPAADTTQETENAEAPEEGANSEEVVEGDELPESEPFQFAITNIALGGDNKLGFNDRSIEPAVELAVKVDSLTLGAIDSKEPTKPSPLKLLTSFDEYSSFTVEGELTPLKYEHLIDLKAAIKGYPIPLVSPYAESTIGYAIKSGQLGFDSKIRINDSQMNIKNKIRLNKLELEPVNEALIASLSKQLTMPVGTALDLLKDDNGVIKLELPIEGDLNSPDIDIKKIVQLATTQALKKGSVTYLKFALQPYGAIWMAAEAIGEMSSAVALEPVKFTAQTDQIIAAQQDYLPKIATILEGRKNLTLKLCPVITVVDVVPDVAVASVPGSPSADAKPAAPTTEKSASLEAKTSLTPEEVVLAKSRMDQLKRILVKEHGVSAEQLLGCRAKWGEGEPRVMMEL